MALWGNEPDEGPEFLTGMLISELATKINQTRMDPALLQQLQWTLTIPSYARAKVEKLAESSWLTVEFSTVDNDSLRPIFRLMTQEQRQQKLERFRQALEDARLK